MHWCLFMNAPLQVPSPGGEVQLSLLEWAVCNCCLWNRDSNEVLNNKEAISSHRSDLLTDKEKLCGDKCHAGRSVPGTMVQETGFNLMKFQLIVFSINFFTEWNLHRKNIALKIQSRSWNIAIKQKGGREHDFNSGHTYSIRRVGGAAKGRRFHSWHHNSLFS